LSKRPPRRSHGETSGPSAFRAPQILPHGTGLVAGEPILREIAVALAGASDFGDEEYEAGLGTLLASLDQDADLSEVGRQVQAGMILTALAGRLLSEKAMQEHPRFRDVDLGAPIIIIGLPRTGTTALQSMLCADPAHQGLELFLGQSPEPRPERARWHEVAGYRRCLAMLEQMPPEMRAIHPMQADQPDECWHLLRQSFASVTFECAAGVQSYSDWWASHDMRPAYQRWANNLRMIGLNDPGRAWVLKDPSHLFACDALLEAVPEARIIMTHRDPACSIPSVASLNAYPRGMNDRVPNETRLGAEQLDLWARGIERMMAVRDTRPEQFQDVYFEELRTNPLGVAQNILAGAGRSLSDQGAAAMTEWSRRNQPHPHRYETQRFGLRADAIRDRFARYIEVFDVPREG